MTMLSVNDLNELCSNWWFNCSKWSEGSTSDQFHLNEICLVLSYYIQKMPLMGHLMDSLWTVLEVVQNWSFSSRLMLLLNLKFLDVVVAGDFQVCCILLNLLIHGRWVGFHFRHSQNLRLGKCQCQIFVPQNPLRVPPPWVLRLPHPHNVGQQT